MTTRQSKEKANAYLALIEVALNLPSTEAQAREQKAPYYLIIGTTQTNNLRVLQVNTRSGCVKSAFGIDDVLGEPPAAVVAKLAAICDMLTTLKTIQFKELNSRGTRWELAGFQIGKRLIMLYNDLLQPEAIGMY